MYTYKSIFFFFNKTVELIFVLFLFTRLVRTSDIVKTDVTLKKKKLSYATIVIECFDKHQLGK